MRTWKTLLIFVLIFALLGGAYLFIENYDPTPKAPAVTPSPAIALLTLDANLIQQLDIQNSQDSFSFVRNEATGWVVKNNPYAEIHAPRVESLAFSCAALSADTLVAANTDDLAAFGLDKPQCTITLLMQNNDTFSFIIGNQTPALDGYYCMLKGNADVYKLSASFASQFLVPLSSFRVMTVAVLNQADIRSIKITKSGEIFHVQYEAPPEGAYPGSVSSWHIKSPIERDADDKLVQEKLLTPLSMISALDVVADRTDNLSVYGFDGDTVEIQTETETVRFSVGEKDDMYFIMPEGKTTVYSMGTLPFMSVSPFDILEKMTNLISIDTVDNIAIDISGKHFILRVEQSGEEMQFFINDMPCKEEAFKNIYVELSALSVDGMIDASVKNESLSPSASIIYSLTDGSAVTLSYYPYDSLNYAVSENGESTFFIKKTKLSALGEKLTALAQNPQG